MPTPRRRISRDLFETRSHAWHSLGLGEELTPRFSKKALLGLLVALLVLAATLTVYYRRQELFPGNGYWVRIGTVVILIVVGLAAVHWLVRGLSPQLYRRLSPATAGTAGTAGFAVRLFAMSAVVVLALRIAGVNASTLAVGGAFTAIVLGLAAQQTLSGIIAGIVLQSTRPFRVGERVRLLESITVPTRYRPSVALEELDDEGVTLRVTATPLRPEDGSQLAEEILEALRRPVQVP